MAPGQAVTLSSPALTDPLTGSVSRVGLEVERQSVIASDPAANTDARIVRVTVQLDPASSARAAALTGLEVTVVLPPEATSDRRPWAASRSAADRLAAADTFAHPDGGGTSRVAFANVLVFVQLGMMGALNGTVGMTYAPVRGDIIISSVDANTLTDGSAMSRRVLFQALSDPEVAAATPFYLAKVDWTREDGSTASLNVYALPVEATRFAGPDIAGSLAALSLPDSALIDQRTRGADATALARVTPDAPLRFEANGRTITATGSFALGGGFSADGAMVVSDQTFLRLFPSRIAGTPTHVLVDVVPGADAAAVAARLPPAWQKRLCRFARWPTHRRPTCRIRPRNDRPG